MIYVKPKKKIKLVIGKTYKMHYKNDSHTGKCKGTKDFIGVYDGIEYGKGYRFIDKRSTYFTIGSLNDLFFIEELKDD